VDRGTGRSANAAGGQGGIGEGGNAEEGRPIEEERRTRHNPTGRRQAEGQRQPRGGAQDTADRWDGQSGHQRATAARPDQRTRAVCGAGHEAPEGDTRARVDSGRRHRTEQGPPPGRKPGKAGERQRRTGETGQRTLTSGKAWPQPGTRIGRGPNRSHGGTAGGAPQAGKARRRAAPLARGALKARTCGERGRPAGQGTKPGRPRSPPFAAAAAGAAKDSAATGQDRSVRCTHGGGRS